MSSILHSDEHDIRCPNCGERVSIVVDLSIEEQSFVEDCQVCCRPIVLQISVNEGVASINTCSEDDFYY